jgi:hypothetical protein
MVILLRHWGIKLPYPTNIPFIYKDCKWPDEKTHEGWSKKCATTKGRKQQKGTPPQRGTKTKRGTLLYPFLVIPTGLKPVTF